MIVKSDSCSYKLLSLKLANFVNYSVIIQMTVTYNYIQSMELIPEYNLYDYWDICCKTATINGNTQTVNLKKLPRFFSCFWFKKKRNMGTESRNMLTKIKLLVCCDAKKLFYITITNNIPIVICYWNCLYAKH